MIKNKIHIPAYWTWASGCYFIASLQIIENQGLLQKDFKIHRVIIIDLQCKFSLCRVNNVKFYFLHMFSKLGHFHRFAGTLN